MDQSVFDEPVRGAIGDLRAFQIPGLEAARRYIRGEFPAPPVWRAFGLHATEVGLGTATFSMPITPWLEDGFGLIWAGIFAMAADGPLAASIWTGLPAGRGVTTSELNLSFVRPCTHDTGNLVGRARCVHSGRQVGLAAVEVSDRLGRLMAYGTTRCVIVKLPVDPDGEYPEPDTGPTDPPDPYLRTPPSDPGTRLDPEVMVSEEPIELLRRAAAGEVVPNSQRLYGARWEVLGPGSVAGHFPTTPWLSAGGLSLYGGAIGWMAEATMGSAIYSTLAPGELFGTLDMNVRFARPALIGSGELTIHAEVQHGGRRLRIATARITSADGRLVAVASASGLVVPGGVRAVLSGRAADEILKEED